MQQKFQMTQAMRDELFSRLVAGGASSSAADAFLKSITVFMAYITDPTISDLEDNALLLCRVSGLRSDNKYYLVPDTAFEASNRAQQAYTAAGEAARGVTTLQEHSAEQDSQIGVLQTSVSTAQETASQAQQSATAATETAAAAQATAVQAVQQVASVEIEVECVRCSPIISDHS